MIIKLGSGPFTRPYLKNYIYKSLLLLNLAVLSLPAIATSPITIAKSSPDRMAWWQEARFGMFIHWGVYTVPAGTYQNKEVKGIGEWIMKKAKIPLSTYQGYARKFNPQAFNAASWAALAKNTGMKYVVVTSKHHDGFAMYPSKVSPWNINDASPYAKDIIGSLAKAFRAEDLKFGLYYSQAQDWFHPGGVIRNGTPWDKAQQGDLDHYLATIALPQSKEIIENYQPDILWWDTPINMTKKRIQPFLKLAAQYPNMLTNNRLAESESYGDFSTPEQRIPATGMAGNFETCMTLNDTWGYKSNDKNWKSSEQLIRQLVDVVSKGGNYLLNIGPDSSGTIPEKTVSILNKMGEWMKVNSESIYGTTASQFSWIPWGKTTSKIDARHSLLYLHVFDWPTDGKLRLPALNNTIESAQLLANNDNVTFIKSENGDYIFTLPKMAPSQAVSVIKVKIKGKPEVGYLYPKQQKAKPLTILASQILIHNNSYDANTQIKLTASATDKLINNWVKKNNHLEAIFKINQPGTYQLNIDYQANKRGKLLIKLNQQATSEVKYKPSKVYQEVEFKHLEFAAAGEYKINLYQAFNQTPMNIKSLHLIPRS